MKHASIIALEAICIDEIILLPPNKENLPYHRFLKDHRLQKAFRRED